MKNVKIPRTILAAALAVALLLSVSLTASALPSADPGQRIHDYAGLFSQEEVADLEEYANQLLAQYEIDLVIVTIDDAEGLGTQAYADDFYDYNGFGVGEGDDGALLLIDMDNREVGISTYGVAIIYLDDEIIAGMLDSMYPYLSDEEYYRAGYYFISEAQSRFDYGREQHLEDYATVIEPDENGIGAVVVEGVPDASETTLSEVLGTLLKAALLALVVSIIIVVVLYLQHKRSMAPAPSAQQYLAGGVKVTGQSDVFLHTHTSSVPIPQNNSGGHSPGGRSSSHSTTHRSSSGRSHGGGTRKF